MARFWILYEPFTEELDLVTLMGLFQFRIFCDSWFCDPDNSSDMWCIVMAYNHTALPGSAWWQKWGRAVLRQRKKSLLLLWHQQFQCQRGFGLSIYRDDSTLRCSAYKMNGCFYKNIYPCGQGSLWGQSGLNTERGNIKHTCLASWQVDAKVILQDCTEGLGSKYMTLCWTMEKGEVSNRRVQHRNYQHDNLCIALCFNITV